MKKGLSGFLAIVLFAVAVLLLSAIPPAFAAKKAKIQAPKAFRADFALQRSSFSSLGRARFSLRRAENRARAGTRVAHESGIIRAVLFGLRMTLLV